MENLAKSWITDGLIDPEYKRYIMLAYLQTVSSHFRENKLYPCLTELIGHHEALLRIQQSQQALKSVFPKEIKGINLEEKKVDYISLLPETEEMKHIQEIVEQSLPAFEQALEQGRCVYDFVATQLHIEPVGILPLYKREGYVLLHDPHVKDISIYRYKLSRITRSDGKYSTLETSFIGRKAKSIGLTFEQVKLDLIAQYPELPNPACFCVQTDLRFPLIETYLPVSKRLLMCELLDAA